MPLKRFQKISRISIEDVQRIVESREHVLISYNVGIHDSNIIPKTSRVRLSCKKCGHEWETRLGVYLNRNAPSGGCRGCYNINVLNPTIYPSSPCIPKPTVENRPKRREGIEKLRESHRNGPFGFIQNREQLVQYLKENPNVHNDFALELLQRDSLLKTGEVVLLPPFSRHHVIPIFAQGSPDGWNIVRITKEEHKQVHELRSVVYGQEGDRKAIYATTSDYIRYSSDSESEISLQKEKKQVNWGVVRRPPEVTFALENGMLWVHKDGYTCRILPNTLETVKEVLQELIGCLPDGHPDKLRLETSSSVENYIRAHICTIFPVEGVPSPGWPQKPKTTAYNFTVHPLAQ